ncbi:zinc finger, C2H2, ENTH/VHS [Artemisia annua]|uniref:Zinc finger, C2H2, ENTH/VHS n=1 Tax=Artemisia annua TaxID=35608 RepID=A0A2U1M373_ARTAN|nr:zinc finger, C2H2, ENTH/VHS [Artemisia annua]
MEMSRSFDRSVRNPNTAKKPRLEEARSIANGRKQNLELVSQYRIALAELTFNSKPIITNLTIIAGENVQAAKAIANAICTQILEVPSDQKLPSLYLLDSIVKNIGRDYIKHFSVKLPEVFCKAYRQVDSALHSGMRHLFGTWKGVFPPQTLQLIDKELGFQSPGNGSSSGLTASRAEPQPQRPGTGRSIHVNPKYLEARQKLQQSNRVKVAASDITTNLISSPEDTGRQDRTAANINPLRGRADPRLKLHQAQRDAESDLTHENSGGSYNNFDFGPDISSERVAEQGVEKAWYASGNNSTETPSRLARNSQIKHGLPNYANLRPMNNLTNKGGSEISRSWKNSEEEEYMWDDVTSVSVNPTSSTSSKRDPRLYFDSERPGLENNFQKTQRMQDLGPRLDRESLTSLRSKGSSLTDENGRLGGGRKLLNNAGGLSTSFNGAPTIKPSGLADGKAARSQRQINTGLSSQSPQDSFSIRPQISQAHKLQPPSPQLPVKHASFLPPYQPEPVSEFSTESPKTTSVSASPLVSSLLAHPKSLVADIPGPPSSSSLLAAVSSIFANKPITSTSSSTHTKPASNNVTNLLSTLVAKGLISASENDQSLSGPTPTSQKVDQPLSGPTSTSQKVSPVVASSLLSTPSTSSELTPSKPVVKSAVTIPPSIDEDIKCLIGFDFKANVIREFHPSVISDLIDDLPHQCSICGLRFKLQERFERHMEWHTLKNSESNTSRSWFSNCDEWVNGPNNESVFEIDGEQMVTADESQIVCVLCGEMFDDHYSPERNKWLFKGATYLKVTSGIVGNSNNGVVVHVNCISEHSLSDLGLANDVKVENDV